LIGIDRMRCSRRFATSMHGGQIHRYLLERRAVGNPVSRGSGRQIIIVATISVDIPGTARKLCDESGAHLCTRLIATIAY
jgi:hypothetical protein